MGTLIYMVLGKCARCSPKGGIGSFILQTRSQLLTKESLLTLGRKLLPEVYYRKNYFSSPFRLDKHEKKM